MVVHGHRVDHFARTFVPLFCFAEQMAEAWSLALEAAKVPEAARQKLIQLGYETQDAFNFDDDDSFKAFMKQFLLVEWKPDGVTEQTWSFHPIVGKLKAVWKKAAGCTHPPSQVLTAPSPATGGLAGALVGHSKTLTVVDRDEMRRELEKRYTGVLVTLASLPSMSLLHTVKAQTDGKAWDWIPWKRLLSEKAAIAVKERRPKGVQDSFMEALALGAGCFEEQWDRELSGAPYAVQAILQVRANAYAMLGAAHLTSWAMYNARFLEYYTKDPGEHFRYMSVAEAEESDQQALREIFGLCYAGASLDDSINTVVTDRDMLRHLMMPRPKVSKPLVDREPLQRKRKGNGTANKEVEEELGVCFAWAKGKCKRKNCRWRHPACTICGKPERHTSMCTEQVPKKKLKAVQ